MILCGNIVMWFDILCCNILMWSAEYCYMIPNMWNLLEFSPVDLFQEMKKFQFGTFFRNKKFQFGINIFQKKTLLTALHTAGPGVVSMR